MTDGTLLKCLNAPRCAGELTVTGHVIGCAVRCPKCERRYTVEAEYQDAEPGGIVLALRVPE